MPEKDRKIGELTEGQIKIVQIVHSSLSSSEGATANEIEEKLIQDGVSMADILKCFHLAGIGARLQEMAEFDTVVKDSLGRYKWAPAGMNKYC
jgi:hypothetical protein